MRIFLYTGIWFLVAVSNCAFAQGRFGKVMGEVRTSDNKSLPYASVLIKNSPYGAMANADGKFSFEVPEGQYTLAVTYAGYTTNQIQVTVTAGETFDVQVITVDAASNQLQEVIIEDIETNKFGRRESNSAARMPLGHLENPQAYSVITKELMQEQMAIDYNSAMLSVPGAVVMNGVNDSGNEVFLRGFNGVVSFRNGLVSNPRSQSEIFNLEKVEVLKGPSGTLFGGAMTSYGGIVNNLTKKPFESYRGTVSYHTGSWGLNRFTVDLNTPLNNDRTALLRVNALGHMENGFQDAGKQRNFGFAASMAFKPNERTTVRFDADIYRPDKPLVAFIRNTEVLDATTMDRVNLPYYRSLLSDDVTTPRQNINASAEIEYRISDHWTSRTSYLHNSTGESGSIFFVPTYLRDEQIERRFRVFDNYQTNSDHLQQNFNGDFNIGNVNNRLVVGVDLFSTSTKYQEMFPVFQVYDTVAMHASGWPPLSRVDIERYRMERANGTTAASSGSTTYSAYFSDVAEVLPRLKAMVSLRLDRYQQKSSYTYTPTNGGVSTEGFGQTFLSPKFGLVYEPIRDQLSFFANYLNAFVNQSPSMGLASEGDLDRIDPSLQTWKPEEANQYEGGLKMNLFNGRLTGTVSYYNIRVSNRLRSIADGISVQDGTQVSKGFEVDIIANPLAGWNIVVGYGYNDNEYIRDTEGNQGKRAQWTPVHVANFWTSYKFLDGTVKGLGLGVGANYVGETYFDVDNTFGIPAYTLLNATIFYDQPKYRVGVKVNNLTDNHYWDFFGKPQKPAEFIANISYKF
ncbi:TonB-dependent receptor [Olivibacter sp. SDN3]|uniref:TonB-dependent receptor n=1 Tax=Olivibacter sp. SDN3 TaxID=2764720 RepID=UPI00165151B8|nr:TonB-dependent receptor [Olivibacter sp. SDN3]QNL51675.1 TonB-dependent receptor [Olivibacter sp. SDN3]